MITRSISTKTRISSPNPFQTSQTSQPSPAKRPATASPQLPAHPLWSTHKQRRRYHLPLYIGFIDTEQSLDQFSLQTFSQPALSQVTVSESSPLTQIDKQAQRHRVYHIQNRRLFWNHGGRAEKHSSREGRSQSPPSFRRKKPATPTWPSSNQRTQIHVKTAL